MIKWLIGLASIAALAWLPFVLNDADIRSPTLRSPSTDELPPTAKPAIGENRPLSVAEIRWCMSQSIQLEAVRPRLATRRAIDHYNELARAYDHRCNGYEYRQSDREQARRDIDAARQQIVAAALDDIQRFSEEGALTPRRAQERLERLGYDPGVTDGVYGPLTKAAIEAFQREEGVLVDGLLSQELSKHLVNALARRATGRTGQEKIARHVVILVVESSQGTAAETEAVADAEVRISGDRGFHRVQRTNERGRIELAAVPAGELDVDVRRNGDTLRYTSQLRIDQEPHQQILLTLPPG